MAKVGEPGAAVAAAAPTAAPTAEPTGEPFTADGAAGPTSGEKERRKGKRKSKGDRSPKGGRRATTHKAGKGVSGGKGPSARDGKEAAAGNASGSVKLSKYWCKFGSDGNAFLRTCLGGVGNDQKSGKGWEFADAAEAIGKGRFKTVQQLYDRIAEDTAYGKSYVEIADRLQMPDRVFLIPNLIKGFDSLLADGTMSAWAPPVAEQGHAAKQPVGDMAHADVRRESAPSPVGPDPNMPDNGAAPSATPRSQNWDELLSDSRSKTKKKQKSAACTIL